LSRSAWVSAFAILAILATRASAQDRCQIQIHDEPPATRTWAAPLDRSVSLQLRNASLVDVLERVATAANFRISYSSAVVPLDRSYCIIAELPAGELLSRLLAGIAADPVVTAPDHVVLAPREPSALAVPALDTVLPLPALVVIGEPHDHSAATTGSTTALEAAALSFGTAATLTNVLNGAVPGVWLWQQSGSALQYGSMRGVSSFGITAPKLYIDGIPVANPLVGTRFAPGSIERIEIVRAPDAGMQYGEGAMSGVTSVTTRRDWPGNDVPHLQLRSAMGFSSSDFVTGSSMTQDHTLNLRLGGPLLSTAANLTAGKSGEVLPGSFVRHVAGDAALRAIHGSTQAVATVRFFSEQRGQPWNVPATSVGTDRSELQSLRQYTAGLRVQHQVGDRWTHAFLVGVDGFAIAGVTDPWRPYVSTADSALRSVADARRTTFRLTSTGQFQTGEHATATLVATAEHTRLQQHGIDQDQAVSPAWNPARPHTGPTPLTHLPATAAGAQFQQDITGFAVQTNTVLYDRVTLSGGLRVERQQSNGRMPQFAASPMLGAAVQHSQGPLGVRLHFAAGKGVRWPQDPAGVPVGLHTAHRAPLDPEEQTAIETGVSLSYGETLTVQLTRFEQNASRLIQRTAVPFASYRQLTGSFVPDAQAGRITNHGWELQAATQRGPLQLAGTYSTVDSRVGQVAPGYSGDLQPGDRMLAVPARTVSLSATWVEPEWTSSITAFRAFDWVNYDRLALNRAITGLEPNTISGPQLRSFWRRYDGSTHLRATLTRQLSPGLGLWVEVDNLLNHQSGEPDNATFFRGRSIAVGVRAAF